MCIYILLYRGFCTLMVIINRVEEGYGHYFVCLLKIPFYLFKCVTIPKILDILSKPIDYGSYVPSPNLKNKFTQYRELASVLKFSLESAN